MKNRILLIILDGWGLAPSWAGNAISLSQTPTYNRLITEFPNTKLMAHGQFVGLPGHEMGNSEVGHLNIGAGRVVLQDSSIINQAISDKSFFNNQTFLKAIDESRKNNRPLHIMGLLSNGMVHSSIDHLFALIELCRLKKFSNVLFHLFSDGRDTPPQSGIIFFSRLAEKIQATGIGRIATVSGRFYAMDRDKNMDRTQKAVEAIVWGKGDYTNSINRIFSFHYQQGKTDEYIPPTVMVDENNQPLGKVQNNDYLIFFNFRNDRARQICSSLLNILPGLNIVGFIPYGLEEETHATIISAFQPKKISNHLTEFLANAKLAQFRIAETEKYAHITYFFNGLQENPFAGEERLLIPSRKMRSYRDDPEMSAEEIRKNLVKAVKKDFFNFLLVNFANADMVGHTGDIQAGRQAVEFVDKQLADILDVAFERQYSVIVTADHGNIEQMLDPTTGEPDTSHTKNPVPFIIADNDFKGVSLREGVLADIAPTILKIMALNQPKEMSGKPLF